MISIQLCLQVFMDEMDEYKTYVIYSLWSALSQSL